MSETHDYRNRFRRWGHDLSYRLLPENRLKATGWGALHGFELRRIAAGDYLLLSIPGDEKHDTRYRVEDIEYLRDPDDMWSATLVFDPRRPEDLPPLETAEAVTG